MGSIIRRRVRALGRLLSAKPVRPRDLNSHRRKKVHKGFKLYPNASNSIKRREKNRGMGMIGPLQP